MRNIPLKNYVFLFLIAVGTFLCVTYLKNVYQLKQDYENNTHTRMGFLKQIHESDFENYITENLDFILYISDNNTNELQELEEELKVKLTKLEYKDDMIYLNSKNSSNNFLVELKKHFSNSLKLTEITELPNILIVKEGKIVQVMNLTSETTSKEVLTFIRDGFYGE